MTKKTGAMKERMKSVKRANEEDANIDKVEVDRLEKEGHRLEKLTKKLNHTIGEEKKTIELRVQRNEIIRTKISQHALSLDGRIYHTTKVFDLKHVKVSDVLDRLSQVDTARLELQQMTEALAGGLQRMPGASLAAILHAWWAVRSQEPTATCPDANSRDVAAGLDQLRHTGIAI